MSAIRDLTGQRFGKLVAIRPTGRSNKWKSELWECKCDCGNTTEVASAELVKGKTQSCGCKRWDNVPFSCKYCDKPNYAKGLCRSHYNKMRRGTLWKEFEGEGK